VAFYNRKKNNSVLPEVDEYYQAERRDNGLLAWLLALISVAVVVAILVGLYFGGRWIVDTLKSDDTNTTSENIVGQGNDVTVDGKPNESTTVDSSTDSNQGRVDAPVATNTPPATTPPATEGNLPNTGPASVASIFIVVSIIAGSGHYIVSRKRQLSQR
jgi:hypothetical protein